MKRPSIVALLIMVPLCGCSQAARMNYETSSPSPARRDAENIQVARKAYAPPTEASPASPDQSAPAPMLAGMMGAITTTIQAPGNAAGFSRKIIYDGEINLVVKDVDSMAGQLVKLVQDAQGYIAEQSTSGSPGSQRSTRWKLRIPVDRFETVVEKVASLGELERNTRTSQDVSEQFYDIEARIKNKKAEEKSLTKILDERSGKLEEVLKVASELSRVRGEIEQLEGRLRVLENLSSLATLVVSVREREKFEPPPPAVADFPTQVARTWENSLRGLVDLGKEVILWAVDWAVWIPLLLVAALLCWTVLRAFVRRLPRLIAVLNTPLTPPRAP